MRESVKSSWKTVAIEAERNRRLELESRLTRLTGTAAPGLLRRHADVRIRRSICRVWLDLVSKKEAHIATLCTVARQFPTLN